MVFSSLTFLIFFVVLCDIMALTNIEKLMSALPWDKSSVRHVILLLASYVFYGWWNWKCCFLLLGLTAAVYFCALGFEKTGKKLCVTVGVVLPLFVLGIFKYFNFFVESFCQAFGIVNGRSLNILLPVGISFYTFQAVSYIIDVYRKRIAPEHSFVKTALYVGFFPELVSGPIVRAGMLLPQFYEDRNISLKNLESGVQIFVFGLFKKLVLADNMSVFVNAVHANPAEFHALTVMLAVAAYSIQLYCDFSGYSDMAVGCARCLGYELPKNFDLPYISRNVSEFWKRWHISLSSWLQDYLYIPLGGNRKGVLLTYVNLMLTMLIGGLWHGAAWTFVAWGGLHGLALCVHKLWMKVHRKNASAFSDAVSVVLTFIFVSICWVFFRADSFECATDIFRAIATWQDGVIFISFWAVFGIIAVTAAEFAAVIRSKKNGTKPEGFYPMVSLNTVSGLAIFFTFLGITLGLAYTGQSPFIYFQF